MPESEGVLRFMAITQQKALSKIFGDPQKKILKRLRKQVDVINDLNDKYEKMSDKELRAQTDELKKRFVEEEM